MSGYSITIKAFLPCGKDNAAHTFAGGCLAEIRDVLELVGCEEIDMRDEYKPNRKSSAPSASAVAQEQPAAGSTTVDVASAAPAAGADLDPLDLRPSEEFLRRVPRHG